jgi:hypothetical protein
MAPGDTVVLDESMMMSCHRDLKKKMKIVHKPVK